MPKMKLKKKKSLTFLKYPLFIIILIVIIKIIFNDIKLSSNEDFINQILYQSNSHLTDEKFSLFSFMDKIKIKEPISILDQVFAYEKDNNVQAFAYIQNNVVDNPRVYIYSTHPTEKYLGEKLQQYEIDNTVVLASVILQEKLNALGIETLVEERSASEYIKENNLSYEKSYLATRSFLKDKLNEYDFDLIIDLHRDAIAKDKTTTTIDGKDYAKVMFVANVNYKDNIALANKLNNIIGNKYESLSRGIYNKYIDNFNQDLNKNVLLLELGGNYNTIDEVLNTIDALAISIKELLYETN